MIPKIIHQIWLGPNPLPKEEHEWIETWKNNHKTWEHILWTNETLPKLPEHCETVITSLKTKYALIADVYRYFILKEFGGVYLDTDILCCSPIDKLIKSEYIFLRPHLKAAHITNAFFGSIPHDDILENCVKNLKPLNEQQLKYGYGYTSGCFLTREVLKHFKKNTILELSDIVLEPNIWQPPYPYMRHFARASHIDK